MQKRSWILLRPFPLVQIQQILGGKLFKGKDVGKHIYVSVKVIVQGQDHWVAFSMKVKLGTSTWDREL